MKQKLILIFLGLKLLYILQASISPYPEFNRLEFEWSAEFFIHIFSNNDSGFYEEIAKKGYPDFNTTNPDHINYSFFPLYPLMGRLLSTLFQFPVDLSLIIVSNICSIVLLFVFYSFAKNYFQSNEKAFIASLVLILFPHHYFFSMMYTESLFLLLAISSFYALQTKHKLLFVICSSLLVITRINGIFFLIPFIIFYCKISGASWKKIKSYTLFIPMLLSLISYLCFLKFKTGSFLAFKEVSEAVWKSNPQNPFKTIYDCILMYGYKWHLSYYAFYSLFFLLISTYFLRRKEYGFFILCLSGILIPLYEGSTISQGRFISVLFPFSLLIGNYIYSKKNRSVLLIVLFVLHLLSFSFWNITHPISY